MAQQTFPQIVVNREGQTLLVSICGNCKYLDSGVLQVPAQIRGVISVTWLCPNCHEHAALSLDLVDALEA